MTTNNPAIIVLGPSALATASTVKENLGGTIYARCPGGDERFDKVSDLLPQLFKDGQAIIALCASGIVIRALAPVLADKHSEPPVLAVAEDGSSAVPLLGGHHGANKLAAQIAALFDGNAAITTASDLRYNIALDEPPAGWQIGDVNGVKDVTAALLADRNVAITIEAGDAGWLIGSDIPFNDDSETAILVTDRSDRTGSLTYYPPTLALGVGCERNCPAEVLIGLVEETLAENKIAKQAIACVTSIDVKADEPAVHALAEHLGVPARFFPAEELEKVSGKLANPSEVVFKEVGCHGVSEGAALTAAGENSRLVVEKTKNPQATCAVAHTIGENIDLADNGKPQGVLRILGIGPGRDGWRAPDCDAALREATDLVAYGLYLELLGDLVEGKELHQTDLGNEEGRARASLELAAQGKNVCLISSGDAGIYAMATLVYELLEAENDPAWNRIRVEAVPGISAVQAAAAKSGAPLGHDFCTISLSDLLTDWEAIEKRLNAAAQGDFVVAFYNPVSLRRRWQLPKAKEILLQHRPDDTPVVLARNLGREGETIRIVNLADLNVDDVDMLTLVLVGSSTTRRVPRNNSDRPWVYTPRGYAKKRQS